MTDPAPWYRRLSNSFWQMGATLARSSTHRSATHQDRNSKAARDQRKRRRQISRRDRKRTRYGLG